MHTYYYKTNISSGECLQRILPHLNDYMGINEWHVDIEHADRILVVETYLSTDTVEGIVKSAGFVAELVDQVS